MRFVCKFARERESVSVTAMTFDDRLDAALEATLDAWDEVSREWTLEERVEGARSIAFAFQRNAQADARHAAGSL